MRRRVQDADTSSRRRTPTADLAAADGRRRVGVERSRRGCYPRRNSCRSCPSRRMRASAKLPRRGIGGEKRRRALGWVPRSLLAVAPTGGRQRHADLWRAHGRPRGGKLELVHVGSQLRESVQILSTCCTGDIKAAHWRGCHAAAARQPYKPFAVATQGCAGRAPRSSILSGCCGTLAEAGLALVGVQAVRGTTGAMATFWCTSTTRCASARPIPIRQMPATTTADAWLATADPHLAPRPRRAWPHSTTRRGARCRPAAHGARAPRAQRLGRRPAQYYAAQAHQAHGDAHQAPARGGRGGRREVAVECA